MKKYLLVICILSFLSVAFNGNASCINDLNEVLGSAEIPNFATDIILSNKEVAKFLDSRGVSWSTTNDGIVISTNGKSPLNKFAKKVYEKYDGLRLRYDEEILKNAGAAAYFSPEGNEILLPASLFSNELRYDTTGLHELVHAIVSHSTLIGKETGFDAVFLIGSDLTHGWRDYKNGFAFDEVLTYSFELRLQTGLLAQRIRKFGASDEVFRHISQETTFLSTITWINRFVGASRELLPKVRQTVLNETWRLDVKRAKVGNNSFLRYDIEVGQDIFQLPLASQFERQLGEELTKVWIGKATRRKKLADILVARIDKQIKFLNNIEKRVHEVELAYKRAKTDPEHLEEFFDAVRLMWSDIKTYQRQMKTGN